MASFAGVASAIANVPDLINLLLLPRAVPITATLQADNVLDDHEIDLIRTRVLEFNQHILEYPENANFPHLRVTVIDINELFQTLDSTPTGGNFSLDLIHPSTEGHRQIANFLLGRIRDLIRERVTNGEQNGFLGMRDPGRV